MADRRTYSFTLLTTLTTLVLVVGVAVALVLVGYNTTTTVGAQALKDRFGLLYDGASSYLRESVRAIGIAQRTMIAQRPGGADDILGDEHDGPEGAMAREPYRSLAGFSREFPVVSAVYFGYGDGSFAYYADLRRWPEKRRAAVAAPAEAVDTVWQIRGASVGAPEAWRAFYDEEGALIAHRPIENEEYDPRIRPWYRDAVQARTTILTSPYVFASTQQLGLTIATRFPAPEIVAGADMVLDDVARFAGGLRLGPSSLVVVFTEDGWVIGHRSDEAGQGGAAGDGLRAVHAPDSDDPILRHLMRLGLDPAMSSESVEDHGRAYLLAAAPIRIDIGQDEIEGARDLYLGVATPIDEMNAGLRRSMTIFAVIGLGGLLAGALMAVVSARALARPISRLGAQARQLADLDFGAAAAPVASRVSEVRDLADALERARGALRIFGTYVPRQLVERLVRNPSQARLGGEHRHVAIMFTDVAGYSAIAEKLDAEALMVQTSRYFDRIGQAVAAHNGIIDKFIGDSIMAIWNAPEINPRFVADCCRGALAIEEAVRAYNAEAEARGEPAFRTRVGIHCGECVVGNVGSADRLSYTAIGSEVNLASRVEGLNGLYGTSILATRAVADGAGDAFVFRRVDRVVPVGVTEGLDVYELMAERPADADDAPDRVRRALALAGLWERAAAQYDAGRYAEAARAFEDVLAAFPDDRPARLLAERCAAFAREGAPEDWRGAFHAPVKKA